MAFTTNAGSLYQDYSGAYYTYANNAVIVSDNQGDAIGVYGAYNQIYGNGGNDSIGVLTSYSNNGNHNYLDGGSGDDIVGAGALTGDLRVTLTGGDGANIFVLGCNSDSTIEAVVTDYQIGGEPFGVFYGNGSGANFVANVVGNDLIINDNAGRLNVTLQGVTSYDAIAPYWLYYYPQNIYSNYADSVGRYLLYYGSQETVGNIISRGGIVSSGLNDVGNTVQIMSNFTSDLIMCNTANFVDESVVLIDAGSNANNMRIYGNWQSNQIISGSGQTTLFGGNGQVNDILVGGSGRNYFVYTGQGNDVAQNFCTGMAENSDVAAFWDMNFSSFRRSGGSVFVNTAEGNSMELQTGGGESEVILFTTDGTNIRAAVVANEDSSSVLYYQYANYYQLNQVGTLAVTDSNNNTIYLDGSDGKAYANVINIDASASFGENVLVGNAGDNVIIGGNGNSTLWGGSSSSNDTLIGGNAQNVFWYGRGEGNDVITNSDQGDSINLHNINFEEFSNIDATSNSVSLIFNTGQQLTVNDSGQNSATFIFATGERFRYNHSATKWENI